MIIKRNISTTFRGMVSEGTTYVKDFIVEHEKRLTKSDKAYISKLLQRLISMKYRGKGNTREYIMEMSHIAAKLKELKLEISEDLLGHLILIFLRCNSVIQGKL